MVRALVRQFGQDNIEFQAFHDDLVEEEMSAVMNYNYNAEVGTATAMAPMRQSAKLASVDAPFRKDAIKGIMYNYGTNIIFIKKDDNQIA